MEKYCEKCGNKLDENLECPVCNPVNLDDPDTAYKDEDWEVVHSTSDEFDAEFIAANLNRAGITARVLAQTHPFTFSELAIIKVMVPIHLKEEAEKIINEIDDGELAISSKNGN